MTQLIEFKNHKKEILRGLLDKTNSQIGIIFVHGFERTSIETRTRVLVDRLKSKYNLFRFDFSGGGLSDGDFSDFTVDKSVIELAKAIQIFINKTKVKKIILVGHSIAGSIIANYFEKYKQYNIEKIILFAPAFNQKDLLRYFFVRAENRNKKITWQNYRQYLDKKSFIKDIKRKSRMTKEHIISNKYFLENYSKDYIAEFQNIKIKKIIIHGDKDEKVPIISNAVKPNIVIKNGDHDLQRPDMVKQWLQKVIKFIQK